ncbi:hypothetical protein KP509_10G018700 [Ceratopteris richardii]|uniref:RING-type domain-containing protein n=1 Tax=Ceratopteris richardii TaxID=49495 RepID=A0A8T2U2J0_CERRI|nr:hypothetical protein KP509_10G018700 [Ceratopteris richardii]
MFDLAARRNPVHHLFAFFLIISIATVCWCCWRRGRSLQRRQELLPRRALSHTATSPTAPSSPLSSAAPTLTHASTRLDPHTAALLPVISYRAHPNTHTGEFSSPGTDNDQQTYYGDADDSSSHSYDSSGLAIKNSDCAICLSSFDNGTLVIVLPSCNHGYHPSCINQWVQSHKDCPVCRTEISLSVATMS